MSTESNKRSVRLARSIQTILGEVLVSRMTDVGPQLPTLTGVQVSDDLRWARVFVSFLGNETEAEEGLRRIVRAGRFLRGELGRKLAMRYVPRLHFVLDTTQAKAAKLEAVFGAMRRATAAQEDPEPQSA